MPAGKVYLIGAGPGSPDLLTVRGLRALREAAWIIADSLLPDDYLADLGIAASTRITRLEHGDTRDRYDQIMEDMVRSVEQGQVVARLKSGDPFVFGRGCEEIEFMAARSVQWEVVPGISVCTAGPTLAALPLSSRNRGRSFAVVTARCSGGGLNRTFPQADSLIIFMGAGVLQEIADGLARDGWSLDTPAEILSRVSLAWERRCAGRLDDIAATARENHIVSPAILVVGAAAARETVLPRRPRILFAGEHPDEYAHLGEMIHWPATLAEPVDPQDPSLARRFQQLTAGRFDWIVFSDPTSAQFFFREVDRRGLDSRLLGGVRIAAAGRLARHFLREHGLAVDLVIEDAAEFPHAWAAVAGASRRVLVCRGRYDPRDLEQGVRDVGGFPASAILVERRPHPDLGQPLPPHDAILFTRPGQPSAYARAYGPSVLENAWVTVDRTQMEVDSLRMTVCRHNKVVAQTA